LKLKTVRVRRSRPSPLAMALALMLTMLCVYLISLPGAGQARPTAARTPSAAEVQLPGLQMHFQCAGKYPGSLEARLAAARCAQAGGAGLILNDGDAYAVVDRAGGDAGESSLLRSAEGLTLRLNGSETDVRAIGDAALLLQSLHGETGALADALERGDTNAASIAALMNVYRTRAERALEALIAIEGGSPALSRLLQSAEDALANLECTLEKPTAAHLRHLHAFACADWICLLQDLTAMAENEQASIA